MSDEEDDITFDVRKRRDNEIRCQEKKIKSDSMSDEEDDITFDVRRRRYNEIPCQEKTIE
jgi:hypothetical protein